MLRTTVLFLAAFVWSTWLVLAMYWVLLDTDHDDMTYGFWSVSARVGADWLLMRRMDPTYRKWGRFVLFTTSLAHRACSGHLTLSALALNAAYAAVFSWLRWSYATAVALRNREMMEGAHPLIGSFAYMVILR